MDKTSKYIIVIFLLILTFLLFLLGIILPYIFNIKYLFGSTLGWYSPDASKSMDKGPDWYHIIIDLIILLIAWIGIYFGLLKKK